MIPCIYYDPRVKKWLNGFCDSETYFTVYPLLESGEPDETAPFLTNLVIPLEGALYE